MTPGLLSGSSGPARPGKRPCAGKSGIASPAACRASGSLRCLPRPIERSISTTEEGDRLLVRLRHAFAEIAAATEELDERRARPTGIVKIIMPRIAYRDLMELLLPNFHAAYPDVVLEIHLDDAITDIVSEGYDIGLRLGEYLNPETVAFPVGPTLRQIAVASPAYVAAHGTPSHPRDLANHLCINWRPHRGDAPYAWEFSKDDEQIIVAVRGPLT
ncbi:LysR substrate-binding domain-containing protein [Nitratireductor sp. GCM10026969]|uniref:LysR substrate-binding domain-containing protein n=1 Tax=Nitratireductor sp. GCM10026969 TaxID=3252645 RepID=UPI003618446F